MFFPVGVFLTLMHAVPLSRSVPARTGQSSRAGQAALIVTLGSVVLFGLLGLVVDVGYGYYLKQVAQAAADSAAVAGATMAQNNKGVCGDTVICQSNTVCPTNPTRPPVTNFDAACLYASANGFPSTSNQHVVLSGGNGTPPNSGVNVTYWITATATQTMPLSFSRIFGVNSVTVNASASSGLVASNAAGGCIWVLDSSGNSAFNEGGSGH